MTTLTADTRVKATPEQVSSELGKEVVILHIQNGMYYGLDEVGVEIWRKLQNGATIAEIVAAVMNTFDVDATRCEQDVLRVLSEMIEAKLVTIER